MILSDADILKRLEDGDLAIDPLDDPELQIQPASVDLRLGREFLEFQRTNISCIHPDAEHEVDEYVTETVVDDDDDFILHPGDFVLGTTYERVEIPADLIAHVEGRSSLGRLAVVVHASLPADEEVFLWTPEDGYGFYEIGDIVKNERPAHAVAFDPKTLRVSTHPVTNYITNPTKRIYRVTLESGRQVHVTKDHNLFTIDEWGGVTRIPSEDAEGTHVMVPDQLPGPRGTETELDLVTLFEGDDEIVAYAADGLGTVRWTDDIGRTTRRHYESRNAAPLSCVSSVKTPDDAEVAFKQSDARLPRHLDITPEFGWVLGFYIAEGSVRRKQVQIANTDSELLDRVESWFEQYGTSIYRRERNDGVERLTVCSALWAKLFRRLAGEGAEKNVPERAWNWSDDVLEALLEGMLDGDGCRRETRDTLYTANEALADRTLYLASRLGLLSSTYSRERENYIEPSDVHNSGTEWAIDLASDAHKRGQYVPVPSELLRSLREEAELRMIDAAEKIGYSSKSSISNVENEEYGSVKRSTLRRFCDVYADEGADTERLEQLLEGGVRFEKVAAVEETDRVEPTYDLEVQPNGRTIENFLGGRGGVFLSNTAGLCDPGYRGQITLELSNLGTAPVALTPGMRISQLTFTELKTEAERPYGSERGSKYQDQHGPQASRIQSDDEFGGDQLERED
ncbi:deoxycytidine triphosphate deaminase [Natronococcus occultus SP4]|uniref:Deoxycytidine triphosphate deaminase n=1 Tax=Natronococcus occultus SP4 TaxID=694430 RepID=L0JX05_9EURY|nr:deoxycytidine triphosphate deaminase [Natronococcus occultus SP4]